VAASVSKLEAFFNCPAFFGPCVIISAFLMLSGSSSWADQNDVGHLSLSGSVRFSSRLSGRKDASRYPPPLRVFSMNKVAPTCC